MIGFKTQHDSFSVVTLSISEFLVSPIYDYIRRSLNQGFQNFCFATPFKKINFYATPSTITYVNKVKRAIFHDKSVVIFLPKTKPSRCAQPMWSIIKSTLIPLNQVCGLVKILKRVRAKIKNSSASPLICLKLRIISLTSMKKVSQELT